VATSVSEYAWQQQRRWSQAANRLKRRYERARAWLLGLTVAAATLAAAAVVADLSSGVGKALSFAAALASAFAALVGGRANRDAVRDWTRARSVSEAIKSEVYVRLLQLGPYADPGPDTTLDTRVAAFESDAAALLPQLPDPEPATRPLPDVHDVASYLEQRVNGQVTTFYRPRAAELAHKLRTFRRVELALAGAAAVLAAIAGTWGEDTVAVWVPVVTTVAAAVTSHVATARYEFLLADYLRTADELERIRDRRGTAARFTDEELVRHAEEVISAQNQAWMAKLTRSAESGT
jgi:hypothetical protein